MHDIHASGETHLAYLNGCLFWILFLCLENVPSLPQTLELLERSLAILERHYGPEHVDVAKTRRGLGKTHLVLGDVAAARSQLERAIEFYEAKFGANHRETCRCRDTLTSLP